MRHAAITLAEQVRQLVEDGQSWQVVFCSDMLNLAEFRGLAPATVASLPAVAYFHENQLTYPVQQEREYDYHFAFTNFTTALSAESVWFNSAFHRDAMLTALREFLARMPDHQPLAEVDRIAAKSVVHPPGIESFSTTSGQTDGPLHILWAARWEHDKDPQSFFAALEKLRSRGIDFRVSVLGESFRKVPEIFATARESLSEHIDRWGYQSSREEYLQALSQADVVVSTAIHEFFGIAVLEAMAAGAYPLLPQRLSYPGILGVADNPEMQRHLYSGDVASLADALTELVQRKQAGDLWQGDADRARRQAKRFDWEGLATTMDQALQSVAVSSDP